MNGGGFITVSFTLLWRRGTLAMVMAIFEVLIQTGLNP
jgi:hypothetical protein